VEEDLDLFPFAGDLEAAPDDRPETSRSSGAGEPRFGRFLASTSCCSAPTSAFFTVQGLSLAPGDKVQVVLYEMAAMGNRARSASSG